MPGRWGSRSPSARWTGATTTWRTWRPSGDFQTSTTDPLLTSTRSVRHLVTTKLTSVYRKMPRCTHKGCGKEYDAAANADGVCLYHPGGPVFHEGLKSWCKLIATEGS